MKLIRPLALTLFALTLSSQALAQSAETLIAQGRSFLAAQDITNANARFAQAVATAPSHQTGNVFYAATRLLSVVSQKPFNALLDRLGISSTNRDLYAWDTTIAQDTNGVALPPPGVSAAEVSAFLRTNLLPQLIAANATNLARVTQSGFLLTLTSNDTSAAGVTLDYGDILLIRAMMYATEMAAYTITAQNVDGQLSALRDLYDTDLLSVQNVLLNFTNLLTYASTNDLPAARRAFTNAVSHYLRAATFIRNRADGVTRLFNFDAEMAEGEQNFRMLLEDLEDSLTSPVVLRADTNITIHLARFFDGKRTWRSFLPAYTNDLFIEGTVPDPTFGGVVFGLTSQDTDDFFSHLFDPKSPDARFWVVAKGQQYFQTNSSAPTLSAFSPYVFHASVDPSFESNLLGATLSLPNATTVPLPFDWGGFALNMAFNSQAELDAAYANGLYGFRLEGANDGTNDVTVNLQGDAYPSAPRISNFSEAQAIHPRRDFVLRWDAMAGGTSNDFLSFSIDNTGFETPPVWRDDALNGLSASVVIPAGTLQGGQVYEARLMFAKVTARYPTNFPAGLGAAAYFKETTVYLRAIDVDSYGVFKGQSFTQNSDAAPAPVASGGCTFNSFVRTTEPYTVNDFSVRLPTSVTWATNWPFNVFRAYNSLADLEVNCPNGTYQMTIHAVNDGTKVASLNLSSGGYPASAPRISNFTAAQWIDIEQDFVLTWDAFPGGATNDYIWVSIQDPGSYPMFQSPMVGERGALNGTHTSVVIPRYRLVPGQNYRGTVRFFKASDRSTTAYAGATGRAAFFKETTFPLATASAAGSLQFSTTHYFANEASGIATLAVKRVGGSEGEVSVFFTTQADTATAGSDFTETSGMLTFGPGVTQQTIPVPLVNDASQEYSEILRVLLFNPTGGASLGMPAEAVLVIEDNDKPPGPDVVTYLVGKGQRFAQTSAAAPALRTDEPAFGFQAGVVEAYPGAVTNASLRAPNGATRTLTGEHGALEYHQDFATKSALDSAYGSGNYVYTFRTRGDGTRQPSLNLPSDNYPTTPQINNWFAAQQVDATADFTVRWGAFSGGTTNDYIQLQVEDDQGNPVYSSPNPGSPGALNGQRTSAVIPAGTLEGGRVYRANLIFAKVVGFNLTTYPDSIGVTAYFKQTQFALTTLNPAGMFQFSAASSTGNEADAEALITVTRLGGSQGRVSVDFATSAGTATPGEDFVMASGTLVFEDGVTSQSFAVSLANDDNLEGPETLWLALSNPGGGATLGSPATAALLIIDDEVPAGADALMYVVTKGQQFVQTNDGPAVSRTNEAPFAFLSFVEPLYPGAVTNASLRLPNGTIKIFTNDNQELGYWQKFLSKSGLDGAYPNGTYTLTLKTFLNGTQSPTLSLPADGYPPTPHVANWLDAQEVDATVPFTLTWDRFTNGTLADYIYVEILPAGDGEPAYQSMGLLEPDSLTGTNTSVTIPGGCLKSGRTYRGTILFVKVTGLNTNGYPGSVGVAGFHRETTFSLATAPEAPAAGRVQFGARTFAAGENTADLAVAVTRAGATEGAVTVEVSTSGGTATPAIDYEPVVRAITFDETQTNASVTVTIPVLDDWAREGNETFNLHLNVTSGGAILGTRSTAVATIVDDEIATAGTLQFASLNYTVAEAGPVANVAVHRRSGSSGTVTVDFATHPASATGDDFVATNGTLSFGPGQTNKTIAIRVLNDAFDETNESFQVELKNPTGGGALGGNTLATVTITDNDIGGVLNFAAKTYTTNENATALITVTRSGGSAGGVTVDYAAADGTATEGLDYAATVGQLAFGSNELRKTFTVPLANDLLPEGEETVLLRLSNPQGGATLGGQSNAVLRILDDEVSLQFGSLAYTNTESTAAAVLTVVRSGFTSGTNSVGYFTANGSAVSNADYRARSGQLVFRPGVTSQTISIPLINDLLVESSEEFNVVLTDISPNAQFGPRTSATVTLLDNDKGGLIAFSATNYTVSETGRVANIALRRTSGTASNAAVQLTLTDLTAVAGTDYSNVSAVVMFKANETNKVVPVPIFDNCQDDTNKTLLLSLSDPAGGASLGKITNAVLTITDNDLAGVISFRAATYTVSATNAFAQIFVTRTGGKACGVRVPFYATNTPAVLAYSHLIAYAGLDDYLPTNGILEFAAGETNKSFLVPILNDGKAEGNERVDLFLGQPEGGATLGKITNASLTILDNAVAVQFKSGLYTVRENGTTVRVEVERSGPLTGTVTVDYAATDHEAAAGADFSARSGRLTFGRGVATQSISIPILNDSAVEYVGDVAGEYFRVSLANPSVNASLGKLSTADVFITDDDKAGVFSFSATNYTANETSRVAVVTVTRTGGTGSGMFVTARTADGTAASGTHYTGVETNLYFAGGATSKTFAVPVIDNCEDNANRTVQLTLSDPLLGATLGARTSSMITLVDNDVAGTLSFSATNYIVSETATSVTVTVTRTGGRACGASVNYRTLDLTASSDDYAPTEGTLVFAANELSKTLIIPLTDDEQAEGEQKFRVLLSDVAGGARLGTMTNATVTIRDNEVPVQGLYKIQGSTTNSACTDSTRNGVSRFLGDLLIYDQQGTNFQGEMVLIVTNLGGSVVVSVDGHVDTLGRIGGTYTDDFSGLGTFAGSLNNKLVRFSFTGQETGETCQMKGAISGSLYQPSATGNAPANLAGTSVQITPSGQSAFQVDFSDGNEWEILSNGEAGFYYFNKTGANSSLLWLHNQVTDTTTRVTLSFSSKTNGTFTAMDLGEPSTSGTFKVLK